MLDDERTPKAVVEPVSLDDLHAMQADEQQEKQIAELLLLPKGRDYQTQPPLMLDTNKVDGRLVIKLFGQVSNGNGNRGSISFRLSPTLKLNPKGRPDLITKLYSDAKRTLQKSGGAYSGPGSVATFLRDYPVRLTISLLEGNEQFPDPSNLVVAISPVQV